MITIGHVTWERPTTLLHVLMPGASGVVLQETEGRGPRNFL